MDLQRISSEHGMGMLAWLFRLFRFPAYRAPRAGIAFSPSGFTAALCPTQQPVEPRAESHPVAH